MNLFNMLCEKKRLFLLLFCRILDKFLTLDKNNKFFLFSLTRNFRTFAAEMLQAADWKNNLNIK